MDFDQFQKKSKAFRITKKTFLDSSKNEGGGQLVRMMPPIECQVLMGFHSYGDSFETPLPTLRMKRSEFCRLSYAILASALGPHHEVHLPVVDASLVRGISIHAARPPRYQAQETKSFSYQAPQKAKLKRYPWYPWSTRCNPTLDLPTFGFKPLPEGRSWWKKNGTLDMTQPHALSVSGYTGGLLRLARMLLDYAHCEAPPDDITLEVEGGFRGVGPHSYEIRFERID
ncbi:MAG: hypothetical protein AB7P37_20055 [Ramlibacter sp.]